MTAVSTVAPAATEAAPERSSTRRFRSDATGKSGRTEALSEVEPAAPRLARDRLLALIDDGPRRSEAVALGQSDPALAWCLLRAGVAAGEGASIGGIVARASAETLFAAVSTVPTFDVFGSGAPRDELMETFRRHARETARVAGRLQTESEIGDRDEVITGALLHDVGRLSLADADPEYASRSRGRMTPEQRLAAERRRFGTDHTIVGERLARRMGLPSSVVQVIGSHHDEDAGDTAALVRLADMLAHYLRGTPIERARLGTAGAACGFDEVALRELMFRLTQLDDRPRSPSPSPLSPRQRELLTLLSDGRTIGDAASELGIAPTTLRSHLHLAYRKLGVSDRARAVMLARERGWLARPSG